MSSQVMLKTEAQQIRQMALSVLVNGRELLNKSYLSELGQFDLHAVEKYPQEKINFATDVRIFKVERVVLENKQSMLESMTSAYTALGAAGYSVFLLVQSNGSETEIYLGTRGSPNKMQGGTAGQLLDETFKGHFAGSKLERLKGKESEELINDFAAERSLSITAVTGVPSLSIEEREHFMQGLEHFIDAAEGREYQALILAEPVTGQQLDLVQAGYEGVATQISPLFKQTLSFGENESDSVGLSISEGISHSFGTSIGLTETTGMTYSVSHGENTSTTNGVSNSTTEDGFFKILGITKTKGANSSTMQGESDTATKGTNESLAHSKNKTETDTKSKTDTHSLNQMVGSNRQITLEMTDKNIEQMLKKVDHQLERVNEARRYGGWNSAAYFISDNNAASQSLASIFLGLMRGANSNSEDFSLTTWDNAEVKERPNKALAKDILAWLANLSHPRLTAEFSQNLGVGYLTPSTLVSGKEMAIQLSLPRRSTSTVTVVEAVPFGRRIQNVNGESSSAERIVNLGKVRHLWQDLPQKVELDVEKLSGHIFVTGSTGSGKSNTVYQLLDQLNQNNVKFLVIEPAKGEYKNVFGYRDDVRVFGTNPKQAALLRINPFKFPATGDNAVHILEHIDRLIEIFSVCWTMYDAMPAILKQAMLDAYQASGWNLEKSCNLLSDDLFPNFTDLLAALKKAIDKSDYSVEVKGNYKGALITRVESLTNGLNKQIFTANEIDNAVLFDENVIVDLSRIGSQETKSLIMGVLVMRLNEYRMANTVGMNSELKHVTVLEEAHNILKNTQGSQGVGGSNVMGKSVEMLSNAIAEMRTFGEGFIIADQSPSTVDISAIRNTNTKIVMRLPDETDRRLAGKASGVTDAQLEEIAKLPKGVAVVYQNDWLEPILCSVYHFKADEKAYRPNLTEQDGERKIFNTELAKFLLKQTAGVDLAVLKDGAKRFDLPQNYRQGLLNSVAEFEQYGKTRIWTDGTDLVNLLLSVFNSQQEALQHIKQSRELSELATKVEQLLNDHICQEAIVMQIVQNDLAELWKTHHSRGVM